MSARVRFISSLTNFVQRFCLLPITGKEVRLSGFFPQMHVSSIKGKMVIHIQLHVLSDHRLHPLHYTCIFFCSAFLNHFNPTFLV